MTDLSPECGDELDDFSPCACAFTPPARPEPRRELPRGLGAMRAMVERKLQRKRGEP